MDLKNYRAPRNVMGPIIGAAIGLGSLLVAGNVDFAYQLDLESQNKVMRAELAALKKHRRAEPAPRPIRCRDKDRPDFYAWQADGEGWQAICLNTFTKIKEL